VRSVQARPCDAGLAGVEVARETSHLRPSPLRAAETPAPNAPRPHARPLVSLGARPAAVFSAVASFSTAPPGYWPRREIETRQPAPKSGRRLWCHPGERRRASVAFTWSRRPLGARPEDALGCTQASTVGDERGGNERARARESRSITGSRYSPARRSSRSSPWPRACRRRRPTKARQQAQWRPVVG
jgi:hypothetical protein